MGSDSEANKNSSNNDKINLYFDWRRFLDVNEVARYADSHYREMQVAVYVVGASGLLLVFRSLRLFSKFTSVRKIPDSYFRKQVKLNGFVRSIEGGEKATINVEHIPIVELNYHKRVRGLLPVRLAGLGPWHEPEASKFVADRVLHKRVTFQLIEEGPKEEFLVAAVYHKPCWWMLRNRSLNAEIVERGFAPYLFEGVELPDPAVAAEQKKKLFQPQPVEHRLAARLMEAQKVAQKKKIGLWQEVSAQVEASDSSLPAIVPAKMKFNFNPFRSVTSAVSRTLRYTVSAIVYFPAQVKDRILQKRSIS